MGPTNRPYLKGNQSVPGVSIRDLSIFSIVGGHLTFERVTNQHPKKVTEKCQGVIFSRWQ